MTSNLIKTIAEIKFKLFAEYGFGGGLFMGIIFNWEHIADKVGETAVLGLVGGIAGGVGGLIIALLKMAFVRIFKKNL